jgi:hypothetical protein
MKQAPNNIEMRFSIPVARSFSHNDSDKRRQPLASDL